MTMIIIAYVAQSFILPSQEPSANRAELSGKAIISILFYFNAAVPGLLLYKRYFRGDSAMFMRLARVNVNVWTGNLALQII